MEHRWGVRTRLTRPVRIHCRGALPASAVLSDISVSGALLETSVPYALHSRLEVHLFPMGSRHAAVEAVVVRVGQFGLGVEWTVLAPQSVQCLLNEVAQVDAVPDGRAPEYVREPRPKRSAN